MERLALQWKRGGESMAKNTPNPLMCFWITLWYTRFFHLHFFTDKFKRISWNANWLIYQLCGGRNWFEWDPLSVVSIEVPPGSATGGVSMPQANLSSTCFISFYVMRPKEHFRILLVNPWSGANVICQRSPLTTALREESHLGVVTGER